VIGSLPPSLRRFCEQPKSTAQLVYSFNGQLRTNAAFVFEAGFHGIRRSRVANPLLAFWLQIGSSMNDASAYADVSCFFNVTR